MRSSRWPTGIFGAAVLRPPPEIAAIIYGNKVRNDPMKPEAETSGTIGFFPRHRSARAVGLPRCCTGPWG
jgi:hypothetical protein